MIYIYLIYGLSFFILWTVLWIYHKNLGRFFLARNLWLLGLFAAAHGMSDWMSMLVVVQDLANPLFKTISLILLIASFYFLAQFGVSCLVERFQKKMFFLIPLLLLVAVATIVATTDRTFLYGEIFARYLLGVPGTLLTIVALIAQLTELKKIPLSVAVRELRIASVGFLFYAVFTGLVVPEAGFFPASVLNYRIFTATIGLPVEIFRTLSVLVITYAVTRILHEFEVEAEQRMVRMNEALENKVSERTAELNRLNDALRRHEFEQQAILNNIPDIAWLKDEHSRFVRVNEAFARAAGTEPEEAIGKTDSDLWSKDLAERYLADDREVMRSGNRKQIEEPLIDKDFNFTWIETIKTPIFNERGAVIGTAGIARDVTERKKTLDAVNAERAFRKAIEDSVSSGIVAVDLGLRQSYVNPAFCRMVGWSEQELLQAEAPFVYWPPEQAESISKALRESIAGNVRPEGYEFTFLRRSGERFDVLVQNSPLKDGFGRLIGLLASVSDITDRKRATEAVQESEQRYRAVTDNAMDGIVTVDEEHKIVLANPSMERIFGYERREIIGSDLTLLMPDRYRSACLDGIKQYIATGKRHVRWSTFEMPGLHKDGAEIPLEMSFGEYVLNGKHFFTGIMRDVTARKKMETALHESERLRQVIMDSVPALISYVGSDLRYRFVNHQYETWWRRPASTIVGTHIRDTLGPERYKIIEDRLRAALQGQRVSYEWTVPREDEERFVQVTYVPHKSPEGQVLGFFTLINDITELKLAEQALIDSEQRIQLIVNAVPALISYIGPDLRYRYVNRRYEEWFGRPAAEIVGKHVKEILGESLYQIIEKHAQLALRGETTRYECSLKRDSEDRFLRVEYVPHSGANREVYGFFALITDITDRKKIEEGLQRANQKLTTVLNSIAEAYYAFDSEWRIVEMNREAAKILGPASDLIGENYWERFSQNRGTEIERQYRAAMEEKREAHFEERSRVNNRWYEIHAYPREERLEVYFTDITGRKKLEEIIEHRAYHDYLTDLPNRLLFEDIVKVEVAQAHRHQKRLAILFLDLDRFKEINDTLGHDAGDHLLKQVAGRLRKSVRQSDTVARIGGDEFNILLSDVADTADIEATVKKIKATFQNSFSVVGEELRVTTSVGISVYPDDSRDIETLLKHADMAMYDAKEHGRNRYQFYNEVMNRKSLERTRLEQSLRQALDEKQFVLYYLPQADARSRKVVGVEALIRWQHPSLGLLGPERFMTIAEETGLIIPIGEWVLQTVLQQMKAWHQAGYAPLPVTVNLSERQFHQKNLAQVFERILHDTGLDPQWLEIEITERTAMKDLAFTAPHLRSLARLGVRLSLDDFGTGYLSLNGLKKLPIGKLKIDTSLIKDVISDADDRMVVEAMIALTHTLHIRAVAEGVETEDQLRLLQMNNCDEVQGYIFSEPKPVEEFEKMLVAA